MFDLISIFACLPGFVYHTVSRSRWAWIKTIQGKADMRNQTEGSDDSTRGLAIGSSLGKYRIIEHLGTGGRGTVYRVNDTELKRDVALKILSDQEPDQAATREYLTEARAAASVNHTNIVTVYDAGLIGGQPFIAMELVTGHRLDRMLSGGPLDQNLALDITRQLLLGLQATHSAGIIHRDIKPSNIVIDNHGRVCLLDFGIASSRFVSRNEAGATTGTVAYMAPEQISGGQLSPATDLYAIGTLLFEMLSGELPFKADYEAALIYSIVNQTPLEIKEHCSEIRDELNQLVNRLLCKCPEDRYQSAEELLADIDPLQEPRAGRSTAESPRSRWGRIGLSALLVLAATVSLTLIFQSDSESPVESNLPPRLAVLPFENQGETEDGYFVNGVTDAIAVQLSRLEGLRVIDRASVARSRAKTLDPDSVGRGLGAEYLLTGTVYLERSEQKNQVRVDAVLTRVGDDTNLWAESYVYELADVFTLQTNIARQVSSALSVRVSNRAFTGTVPTTNIEAYDLYLKGNAYFFKSWSQGDLSNAVHMYSRAVTLDPEFALAHAMLSRGHESVYWEYYDRTPARCSLSLASAERALEIDPNLPEGKLALAYFYYHCEQDYERALIEFQAVLADWPNNSDLHSALGAVLRRFPGQLTEANLHFKTSAELDPSSHLKAFDVGLTYSMARQYDSAIIYLERALMLEPGVDLNYIYLAWVHIFKDGDVAQARSVIDQAIGHADLSDSRYYWWLARITEPDYNEVLSQTRPGPDTAGYYLHRAQFFWLMENHVEEKRCSDSARIILERQISTIPNDPRYLSYLSLAYARLGNKKLALNYANKATELLPASRDAFDGLLVLLNNAETHMLLGLDQEAIEKLEYMVSIQGFITASSLRVDPLWQPLSEHPSFRQLLQKADSPSL